MTLNFEKKIIYTGKYFIIMTIFEKKNDETKLVKTVVDTSIKLLTNNFVFLKCENTIVFEKKKEIPQQIKTKKMLTIINTF